MLVLKSVTMFSNRKDSVKAAKDIIEQVHERIDFEPDLAFFYSTLKYNGKYQGMLDIFNEEFGDIPQIGASVDGMIFPGDIRMDGAALILCQDLEAKISTHGIKEKGAIDSAKKLAQKINCEKGTVILHFPLAHVPGALKFAEFFAKGFYYSKKCKGADREKQKEFARKFSEYCDRENIFHPSPTIIDIFAQKTGYKVPIIGLNVLHTQSRFNSPNIFCNFEDIRGGISALTIEKDGITPIYDDIFPNKGRTLEETKHIVSNEFKIIKEFRANFEKNILISLNGSPPLEAVKNLIYVSGENEKEFLKHFDKGDYKVYMPYNLLFFNKKTNGAFLIGMGSYVPFDLFPFFMDVSDYSEEVVLAYELLDNKFDAFISSLYSLKHNNGHFVYFCVDAGVVAAFSEKVLEYKEKIEKMLNTNYFGILSCAPSAFIPPEFQVRKYLSESNDNTFYTSAGANACLEI